MTFLVQFGINKHCKFFKDHKIQFALWTRALLLVFEKFTPAYLFQIALEIMWLPILILSTHHHQYLWLFYLIICSWVKLPLWKNCTSKIGPIMHCHVLGSVDLDYKTSWEGSFLKLFSYTDVNECQTGSYSCHAQGQCVNVPGSYSCKCLPGYTGDGKSKCEGTHFQNLISPNANVFKGLAISKAGFAGDREVVGHQFFHTVEGVGRSIFS